MKRSVLLCSTPVLLSLALAFQAETPAAYRERISKWRASQEAALKADEGWLSVAGLTWLKEGVSSLGSDVSSLVRLPASVPARVGTLSLQNGQVTLSVADGVSASFKGKPVSTLAMKSDDDRVTVGAVKFMVIRRGQRIGIRVFDNDSKGLKEFAGMKWYPVADNYRVVADFVPYNPPKKIAITNVLGDTRIADSPGYASFTLGGKKCRLDAEPAGAGLFFNFQDKTSGDTTYPAGRFLDAPGAKDGHVILDFNQAVNPPCAFTAFATCPLPPAGNRLDVAVKAGEKVHHPAE